MVQQRKQLTRKLEGERSLSLAALITGELPTGRRDRFWDPILPESHTEAVFIAIPLRLDRGDYAR
jgi:hypothetical protein